MAHRAVEDAYVTRFAHEIADHPARRLHAFEKGEPFAVVSRSRVTADELLTRRLKDALALVDIRVLDHLIVAGQDVMSFSERGLL